MDSSALAKLYVRETDSKSAQRLLDADQAWVTAAHTFVEVRRVLSIRQEGRPLAAARSAFIRDWERVIVVELDGTTCASAAMIAESTRARTLDALHLAAAMRAVPGQRFVTFDVRQAAARHSASQSSEPEFRPLRYCWIRTGRRGHREGRQVEALS
ncbi:MAG: type II toxin-antitoxin system VapC family toxin [Geodermatophilaceae bacterium]